MIVVSTADLTTAPAITGVNGVVVGNPSALRILVPAGVIKTVVASGPDDGDVSPLSPLATFKARHHGHAGVLTTHGVLA